MDCQRRNRIETYMQRSRSEMMISVVQVPSTHYGASHVSGHRNWYGPAVVEGVLTSWFSKWRYDSESNRWRIQHPTKHQQTWDIRHARLLAQPTRLVEFLIQVPRIGDVLSLHFWWFWNVLIYLFLCITLNEITRKFLNIYPKFRR